MKEILLIIAAIIIIIFIVILIIASIYELYLEYKIKKSYARRKVRMVQDGPGMQKD